MHIIDFSAFSFRSHSKGFIGHTIWDNNIYLVILIGIKILRFWNNELLANFAVFHSIQFIGILLLVDFRPLIWIQELKFNEFYWLFLLSSRFLHFILFWFKIHAKVCFTLLSAVAHEVRKNTILSSILVCVNFFPFKLILLFLTQG